MITFLQKYERYKALHGWKSHEINLKSSQSSTYPYMHITQKKTRHRLLVVVQTTLIFQMTSNQITKFHIKNQITKYYLFNHIIFRRNGVSAVISLVAGSIFKKYINMLSLTLRSFFFLRKVGPTCQQLFGNCRMKFHVDIALCFLHAMCQYSVYSLRIGKEVVLDMFWVKHWEYKSSIIFKLLSLQM